MLYFENPKSLIINGEEYAIRTDYRDILTILYAFDDKDLTRVEKLEIMFKILFIDKEPLCTEESIVKCYSFLECDIDSLAGKKTVSQVKKENDNVGDYKYYSFVKDWQLIVAAMNKYFGCSIREMEYLHWFDFIAAFNDLGESTFTSVVDMRKRKKEGKLDADEKKYWFKNKEWLDLNYEEVNINDILSNM